MNRIKIFLTELEEEAITTRKMLEAYQLTNLTGNHTQKV